MADDEFVGGGNWEEKRLIVFPALDFGGRGLFEIWPGLGGCCAVRCAARSRRGGRRRGSRNAGLDTRDGSRGALRGVLWAVLCTVSGVFFVGRTLKLALHLLSLHLFCNF
jgi:hypothetical protein